jgi:glycosyltransferase involved in cell wall biosynthesis
VRRPRLGIVVSHPIQYQVPLYRYLAEHSDVEPHVFYLTSHGIGPSYDPGFGREVQYDLPLLGDYSHEFVKNLSPRPSPSTPSGAINPGLARALRRASLDAVMVHGWSSISSWVAFSTALACNIPYLVRGETQPDHPELGRSKRAIKHAVVGPLVRRAGACLAIGTLNRSFYLDYGVEEERIFLAPYSVDTERFTTSGNQGRAERVARLTALGLDPIRPTVLFAAKLQPWKRPLDVVAAIDLLRGRMNLVMIGDGTLRDVVVAAARDRPWMVSLGFVNQQEIAEWYGVADLFVLASEHEPWGLAVNEAMAAGAIPIVSDSVGCGPDLVTPDIGWLYRTADVHSLAAAIEAASSAASLDQRRHNARERSHRWGIAATAAGIEAAVESVVAT